jgi:hypothetical protein
LLSRLAPVSQGSIFCLEFFVFALLASIPLPVRSAPIRSGHQSRLVALLAPICASIVIHVS